MKKVLCEVTRKDLLSKAKNETPERYERRLNYVSTIKPLPMAKDLFMDTGTLTVPIKVGDYVVTIHVSGIMKLIRQELDKSGKDMPNRPIVYKALREAVDTSNIYVNCTCDDFKYRFAYVSSQGDYRYGRPETRPAKITNPDNNGSVCKHVTAALVRPSQWLKYVSGWIATVVRAYMEEYLPSEEEQEETVDEVIDNEIDDSVEEIELTQPNEDEEE